MVPRLRPTLAAGRGKPCPWPGQVRLWDQEGSERVVCRSHAAHPSMARLVAIEEDP
jgi:hypothetical protein